MNIAVFGKDMKPLRKRINVRLSRNKKGYLKWTLKLNSKPQNIFDNSLVKIRKSKVTLMLNKPAYVGMCSLDLSKDVQVPL